MLKRVPLQFRWKLVEFSAPQGAGRDRRSPRRVLLELEELETRALLSADGLTLGALTAPTEPLPPGHARPLLVMLPQATPGAPAGYSPQQIQQAYGVNSIPTVNGKSINGAGQTIAIVDAYNDPNIVSDVGTFDTQFGLQKFNVAGGPTLSVVTTGGGSASKLAQNAGWAAETSLDVEWAHAIAPQANILLVEAPSQSNTDLLNAVAYAAKQPGVAAVSMSWGDYEFSTEASSDNTFTTPSGHPGVVFVAASGDNSAYYLFGGGPIWPSTSPNVLSVGGTTLSTTTSVSGQTVWSGEDGWFGSGGGYSEYENEPAFQNNTIGFTNSRITPDVAYNADPNSGYAIYDSFGQPGWMVVGGTSAGAPQWSAIVALADQSRHLKSGGAALDNLQVETTLYNTLHNFSQYANDFHDVATGSNGYAAGTGYDFVTGLGSPKVNQIVPLLAGTTIAPGSVGTVGKNPGGFPGPTGIGTTITTGTSTLFGLVAGRTAGGGLYVSGNSLTVNLPGVDGTANTAAGNPAALSIRTPIGTASGIGMPGGSAPMSDSVLASFGLAGQGPLTALIGSGTTMQGIADPSAPPNGTLFGASGWKGAMSSWPMDGHGMHDPSAVAPVDAGEEGITAEGSVREIAVDAGQDGN